MPTWLTVQVKLWLAPAMPSEALTLTVYGVVLAALAASVPVMMPLSGSMPRPAGRPLAVQVIGSPSLSLPATDNSTSSPAALTWLPGLVTAGLWLAGVTVQLKVWLAVMTLSEAVTVTVYGVAETADESGVPEITPPYVSMSRPEGRPVAS